MSVEQQALYTLADARRALALEECHQYGHQWEVVAVRTLADPYGTPVAVQCTRCTESHAVAADPTDPDPPAEKGEE